MTDFNLRDLVKSVLASSTEADPNAVAKEVLAQIKRTDYRAALEQSLGQYVRVVSNSGRVQSLPDPTNVTPITRGNTGGGRVASGSWKVSSIREGWQRALDARVHIEGGWKRLRDMTSADLVFASKERDEIATRNAAWARHFRDLERLLDEHGVGVVGDLPAEVLSVALGRAA